MKVVFMGTPEFAVPTLRALIDSDHEVIAVYSQPPRPAGRGMKLTASPVQQLAEQHGIPVHTPTSLKTAEAQKQFRDLQADIAVVAAYGLLLPKAILDAPKNGCINVHPSDLPRWRGAAPIQRTIMAGDEETACCIMQMDEGLDTGPVLLKESFLISPTMTAGELHDRMAELGARMAVEALDRPTAPVAQPASGITYANKITKADQAIDWNKPAKAIVNQIRGLAPAPGAVTKIKGELMKVYVAQMEAGNPSKPAGLTLDDQLLINTSGGNAVRILEAQRPGKARQSASQIIKGFPIDVEIYAENPYPQGE